MKPLRLLLTLLLLFPLLPAAAQNDRRIEEQKRVIATLEKKIAAEEQQIAKLKKGRAATEERAQRLARQIESRIRLLDETQKQAQLLRTEIARKNRVAGDLSAAYDRNRKQYAEMVRESYRNYRHQNYLTYIFSSRNFIDMARKFSALREVAAMRERKLQEIETLSEQVRTEKAELDARQKSLAAVTKKLSTQKVELERDARNARNEIRQMSEKEKSALQRKVQQQQQLSVAIDRLRKLSKGNKTGASFSSKTSGLKLPVVGGRVKRYRENMAEITGPKGAQVVSIYEGKVVEIKRNRITDKFDVFIAHGEYITSYANLGSVSIEKGQTVAKNQRIGTIGSAIDALTMQIEYRLVFGIYPPDPSQRVLAENCFK
ncbi:MAG: peptidoglycan DD-metalloendopeptidase family protein [Alistipes sp.]|nr:peptidoglycan DD-metalloendopeptidase family protein [Alistipes senegalensis]MCM1250750.1 peptidoglycan DD-metalloendopeptidase family protein [Alistipes sp.]